MKYNTININNITHLHTIKVCDRDTVFLFILFLFCFLQSHYRDCVFIIINNKVIHIVSSSNKKTSQ